MCLFFFCGSEGGGLLCSNSDWNTGTLAQDEASEWSGNEEGQERG